MIRLIVHRSSWQARRRPLFDRFNATVSNGIPPAADAARTVVQNRPEPARLHLGEKLVILQACEPPSSITNRLFRALFSLPLVFRCCARLLTKENVVCLRGSQTHQPRGGHVAVRRTERGTPCRNRISRSMSCACRWNHVVVARCAMAARKRCSASATRTHV